MSVLRSHNEHHGSLPRSMHCVRLRCALPAPLPSMIHASHARMPLYFLGARCRSHGAYHSICFLVLPAAYRALAWIAVSKDAHCNIPDAQCSSFPTRSISPASFDRNGGRSSACSSSSILPTPQTAFEIPQRAAALYKTRLARCYAIHARARNSFSTEAHDS